MTDHLSTPPADEPADDRTGRPTARVPGRLGEPGPSISFELYPPRSPAGEESLRRTVPLLAEAAPDFFSVTYGASGSSRETSRAVVRDIARTGQIVVAHLTCLGTPPDHVREVARALLADGVRELLALRGDPPAGIPDWRPAPGGLERASELVTLLRGLEQELPAADSVGIGVAANPTALRRVVAEGRPAEECGDLQALLAKQEAGADYAITQVFFDPADYVRYVEAARAAGVTLPLLPGVVPLDDPARLRRLETISGVPVPPAVLATLDAEADDERRRAAGTAMGTELALAVLEAGAPGLHLYTFNQHRAVLDLLRAAGLRFGPGRGRHRAPDAAPAAVEVAPTAV